MIITELENVQPVFKAYCKAVGLREGDDAPFHDFTNWAVSKANEFRRLRGISDGEFALYIAEYITWIGEEKDAD